MRKLEANVHTTLQSQSTNVFFDAGVAEQELEWTLLSHRVTW